MLAANVCAAELLKKHRIAAPYRIHEGPTSDKLAELSQVDLAKVNAYERKNQNRSTVTSRIDALQGDEPWAGYDELSVDEVRAVVSEGDESRTKAVRAYERKHKNRAGVLLATERALSNA